MQHLSLIPNTCNSLPTLSRKSQACGKTWGMTEVGGAEGRVRSLALSVSHGASTRDVSGGGVGEVGACIIRHKPIIHGACVMKGRL